MDRAASDIFWSIVGLAGMGTINPFVMLGILMMHIHEWGGGWWVFCSLTGIFKIHHSDSGIKVHVPRSLLYKRRIDPICTVQRSGVHCPISRFFFVP